MSQQFDDSYEEAKRAQDRGEYAHALEIYENLAKEGHVYSLVLLGDMYAQGKGTSIDLVKAEELFDRAASLGLPEALIQKAYLARERGDMHRYFSTIQQAARIGLLAAQYRLGFCYARGHGVTWDAEKALEVMSSAAERGHIGSKIYVARHLLARPLYLPGFIRGLILMLSAIVQGLVIAVRNPHDDRVR